MGTTGLGGKDGWGGLWIKVQGMVEQRNKGKQVDGD